MGAEGECRVDIRDSPQMVLTLLPTLMQEAACSHVAKVVVVDVDVVVAVVMVANPWDTVSWSDHCVRSSQGSQDSGILDKITKVDFEEGSFPKGKSVT